MAKRKGIWKKVVLFISGFLFGAVLVGGLIAWLYFRMFKEQYYSGILNNANTANMIREEQESELLRTIEDNIRQCIVSADSAWGNDEKRLGSFWYVQRYYKRHKLDVPAEIKSIFDKLPPDPVEEKFAASTIVSVGDKAPDFACTALNGQTISLSELKGKVVLVNFFATWCGPCAKEMPYLQSEVFEKIADDNFFMIAIAREEQIDDVTEFEIAKNLAFPIAADPNGSIFSLFATGYIPRSFVIDKQGIVKWSSGSISKARLEDLVSLIRKELE